MPCADCAIDKIKQKIVPKFTNDKAQSPGERLYLDISYTATASLRGAKYWVLLVDDFTRYCWSFFLPARSG